jgi:hypothetical protein
MSVASLSQQLSPWDSTNALWRQEGSTASSSSALFKQRPRAIRFLCTATPFASWNVPRLRVLCSGNSNMLAYVCRNNEMRSRNRCCRRKSITHSDNVCWLSYPACNARAANYMFICGLYGSDILLYITSYIERFSGKKFTEHKIKCVSWWLVGRKS